HDDWRLRRGSEIRKASTARPASKCNGSPCGSGKSCVARAYRGGSFGHARSSGRRAELYDVAGANEHTLSRRGVCRAIPQGAEGGWAARVTRAHRLAFDPTNLLREVLWGRRVSLAPRQP